MKPVDVFLPVPLFRWMKEHFHVSEYSIVFSIDIDGISYLIGEKRTKRGRR